MAFTLASFGSLGQSGASTHVFTYFTPDTIPTVRASGYFNVTTDMRYTLKRGDLIIVQASSGTTHTMMTVTSATGTSPITVGCGD